jgi:hypothetical protein
LGGRRRVLASARSQRQSGNRLSNGDDRDAVRRRVRPGRRTRRGAHQRRRQRSTSAPISLRATTA